MKQPRRTSTTYGFKPATGLLQGRIRAASESRGFAESRLLTHWAEIVGARIAAIARPVEVGYGRGGLGATLTLLTTGAQAPMLEMEKERIAEKVNACYGYRAIARIRITQTAATGFAEGRVAFDHAPAAPALPDAALTQAAATMTQPVHDDGLRAALAALAVNVFAKDRRPRPRARPNET